MTILVMTHQIVIVLPLITHGDNMNDSCKILILDGVIIQENGIIRNKNGQLIGKLCDDIDFEHNFLKYIPVDVDNEEDVH